MISAAVNDLAKRRRASVWKRWAAVAAKTRVAVSITLAIGACWLSNPTLESLFVGWPVAFAGIALRAWAAGHLRKNQQLAVSGPYAYVRNPLYIGSLLSAVGLGICANDAVLLAGILVVFLLWFLPVVGEEEDHIRKILPGFREYESRVRRFVPALTPRYESRIRFDPKLYLINREHSALLGFLAFILLLCFKLALR